jgi:spore coat protein U-like protein
MSRNLPVAFALIAAAALALAAGAAAQTCTATMTDMNFGNVEVALNQNVDITGTVSINCTGANPNGQLRFCLHLCEGSGGMDNGDANPRFMNNSSGLQYNIYRDGAFTQVWGARAVAGNLYCSSTAWGSKNLVLAQSPFADASGNYSGTITAYGRVFSGQTTMPVGSYSSSFTATSNSQSRFVLAYRNCCAGCNTVGSFQTTSAPFTVSANVVPSCFVTASDLDFGSDSLLSSDLDATSTVSVTCALGQAYSLSLNEGTTPGGTTTTRLMKHGGSASTIPYMLFSDPARSQNWGNSASEDVNGTGTGAAVNHTVYGRVPGQPVAPEAGAYSDTITVTVTY